MRKSELPQKKSLMSAATRALLGGLGGFILALVILFVVSVFVSNGLLPADRSGTISMAAALIGSFAGGLWAVSGFRSRTLLVGTATGGVLFLILLTLGFLIYDSMSLEQGGFRLLLSCLCGGAVAGLAGGKPKKKRRK